LDPAKPVILSSGYSEHESIRDGSGEQAAGFLPKPYSIHDLYAMVASHLAVRPREGQIPPTQGTLPF
jgi:DNA-binding NtrC family response regulator